MYSLQDRVHKPRETRYIFAPLESGNTEELCVKIELRPKMDKPTHLPPLSESVTSEAPLIAKELPTPSKSISSPNLSGVWASRAQFIRPPLEPRDTLQLERTAPNVSFSNSTPNSSVTSITSSGSDSVRKPTQAQGFRGPTLHGAWSKTGSSGAQIVKGGPARPPQPRPMFSVGQQSSDSEQSSESSTPSGHRTPNTRPPPERSHILSSSSSASKLSNPQTYQRGYRQESKTLSHSASGPALTGNREQSNRYI